MKRSIAVLALTLGSLLSLPALAAGQIVYLRDGSVVYGTASTANGVVTVETANGTLRIPEGNVLRIENAPDTAAPTPPPPPPTPPPETNATQPAPAPTSQTREGWYRAGEAPRATPEPAPAAPAWQPAPSGPPVVYHRRDAFADSQIGLEGKLQLHVYNGQGWSRFDDDTNSGLGAGGLEALVRAGVQKDRNTRLDAIGELGFYAGSRDCTDALNTCTPVSAATFYADGGLRLTLYGPPFYFYGQGAIGGSASSFAYGNPGTTSADFSSGGTSYLWNMAGGAGIALDQFTLFGEMKYVSSPTNFDGYTVQMGGLTIAGGLGLVF